MQGAASAHRTELRPRLALPRTWGGLGHGLKDNRGDLAGMVGEQPLQRADVVVVEAQGGALDDVRDAAVHHRAADEPVVEAVDSLMCTGGTSVTGGSTQSM